MKETKSRIKPKNRVGDVPDLRVVGIDFNPGPDAHDRLRRLFTLLLVYADREARRPQGEDSHLNGLPSEDATKGDA